MTDTGITYKILTPALRKQILDAFGEQMRELETCQNNAYVSATRLGLEAAITVFKSLPDGFPVPLEERR